MSLNQREILMKLIMYCDKNKCDLLRYNIGGGTQDTTDIATVIYDNGNCKELYWNINSNEWKSKLLNNSIDVSSTLSINPDLELDKIEEILMNEVKRFYRNNIR